MEIILPRKDRLNILTNHKNALAFRVKWAVTSHEIAAHFT